jgi:hypothetical protein
MFEGKIFFGVTGIPILNIALVKSAFADADPVPFTFAKRTTKSLTLSFPTLAIINTNDMDFAGKKEAWVGIFPIARADIGRYDK